MKYLKIYISKINDPRLNLAVENWIFRAMEKNSKVLMLWQNNKTVVIGRYQNPLIECNLEKMEQDKILLTRRQSGGGAVYHDKGNMNYTFFSERKDYNKIENISIILRALNRLNINAETSERSDITVNRKKVSGSAFKLNGKFAFHHGTLLINTDLEKLNLYLTAKDTRINSKGIKSIRSQVANLSDFNPDITYNLLCTALTDEFCKTFNQECSSETLCREFFETFPEVNNNYNLLKSREWLFEKTPDFIKKISGFNNGKKVEMEINVHKGKIKDIRVATGINFMQNLNDIKRHLTGTLYSEQIIREKIQKELKSFKFL